MRRYAPAIGDVADLMLRESKKQAASSERRRFSSRGPKQVLPNLLALQIGSSIDFA